MITPPAVPKEPECGVLARRCAWCDCWMSGADLLLYLDGFAVTHGLCVECREAHFPERVEVA